MRKKISVNAYADPSLDAIYNKKRNGQRVERPSDVILHEDSGLVEIYDKKSVEQVQIFKTNKSIRNEDEKN